MFPFRNHLKTEDKIQISLTENIPELKVPELKVKIRRVHLCGRGLHTWARQTFLGSSRTNSERLLRSQKSSTRLLIALPDDTAVTRPKHEKPDTLIITWPSVTWSGVMKSMLSPVTCTTDRKCWPPSARHKNSASTNHGRKDRWLHWQLLILNRLSSHQ